MDCGEDEEASSTVHEEGGVDEVINSELMPDYRDAFHTMEWFDSRESLMNWVRERAIPLGIVVIVQHSETRTERRKPRLELCCERSGYPRKAKPKNPKQIACLEQENLEKTLEEKQKSSTKSRESGTKRIGCPFHLKGRYLEDVDQWSLEVICGVHNHAQAQYLEGHAYAGRLTCVEEKLVASLSSTHSRPKEILAALKKSFPNNKSTIKTIYNVRQRHRYVDHAGRSQMQYLLGKLEDHGYYQQTKRCHLTDTLTHMFYAHPTSVQLLRAFPNVLLMDCTYKTNRYRLPLLEIVGVSSTNMTFSVACAYLHSEKEESYIWALTVLKSLMNLWSLPTVIVTDREIALMNAIEITFPTSRHILCRWHINKNLASKCKKKFRKDEWKKFLSSWMMVLQADTEDEYAEYLRRFQSDHGRTHATCVNYALNNWIIPYKERFIGCWTDKVMHYNNTTTNRAEGAHAKLKRWLGSSTGNLEICWEKMHTLLETSFNAIFASFEKSLNVVNHRYNSPVFQLLRGMVSIAALDQILEKMKSIGELGVDPLLCHCGLRNTCGLPCAHEIDEHLRASIPISLDNIDKFWKKLDIEPTRIDVDVRCETDSRWAEMVDAATIRYERADESTRLLMLKSFREHVNPSTTSLVEPEVQNNTRGRPKNKKSKGAKSTKRDKSAFEYAESFNDSCSTVQSLFTSDDAPPIIGAMFTTRPPKQKVNILFEMNLSPVANALQMLKSDCGWGLYMTYFEDASILTS